MRITVCTAWIALALVGGCAEGTTGRAPGAVTAGPVGSGLEEGGDDGEDEEATDDDGEDGDGIGDDGDDGDGPDGGLPDDPDDDGDGAQDDGDDSTGTDGADEVEDVALMVYVAADGVTLEMGPDDATMNTASGLPADEVEPHSDPDRVAEIVAELEELVAPYSIGITTERPASGPYMMVVIVEGSNAGILAISPPDCDDDNPSNIGLVYDESPSTSPAHVAKSAAFTIGLSAGLNSNEEPNDVMYKYLPGPGDFAFTDACVPVASPAVCQVSIPIDECPAGEQNSHRAMLERFGPR